MTVKLRDFYEIGQKVNDDPLVYAFEDFLSQQEVDQLLPERKIPAAAPPKFNRVI
ncbi:MAG: hypothetical protein ACJATW_001280 [Glaciecola sp.]|jgi:hypothetical protein